MKNVLVLTNVYPANDLGKGDTPVVHYFCREWVQLGYNVRVIHYPANFPKLFMWGASYFKKILTSKLGVTIRTKQISEMDYEYESVLVKRIPMLKYKLHGRYSINVINKALNKTVDYLNYNNFFPDVIISHWVNPQLEIMYQLKRKYHVPTCYVAHTASLEFTRLYSDDYSQKLINSIDLIGFRSAYIKESFLNKFKYEGFTFQCYSGIPEKYIRQSVFKRNFEHLKSFIFVGTLIKRKYPAEIIPALKKSFNNELFNLTYVGNGSELIKIKRVTKELGLEDKVIIKGYLERDLVVELLQKSDVFIMISKNETFGLVYLEAMAQGCITIASKKEGFDGIIEHGKNGFLCESGNIDELSDLITFIRRLPISTLEEISKNAILTASSLTDKKAAKKYIDSVEKLCPHNEQICHICN